MGERSILPRRRIPIVGICYDKPCRWRHAPIPTLLRNDDPDCAARQSSRSGESVRPCMARLAHSPSHCDTFCRVVRCQPMELKNGLSRMRGDSQARL
jgi:hypothetical protein